MFGTLGRYRVTCGMIRLGRAYPSPRDWITEEAAAGLAVVDFSLGEEASRVAILVLRTDSL